MRSKIFLFSVRPFLTVFPQHQHRDGQGVGLDQVHLGEVNHLDAAPLPLPFWSRARFVSIYDLAFCIPSIPYAYVATTVLRNIGPSWLDANTVPVG